MPITTTFMKEKIPQIHPQTISRDDDLKKAHKT